jgi:hypothetical protein
MPTSALEGDRHLVSLKAHDNWKYAHGRLRCHRPALQARSALP